MSAYLRFCNIQFLPDFERLGNNQLVPSLTYDKIDEEFKRQYGESYKWERRMEIHLTHDVNDLKIKFKSHF